MFDIVLNGLLVTFVFVPVVFISPVPFYLFTTSVPFTSLRSLKLSDPFKVSFIVLIESSIDEIMSSRMS